MPTQIARYDRSMISSLPTPVARYFDFALMDGQRAIERACIKWSGEFSIRPRRWSAFTATQHYRVRPPGFIWDARISIAPIVPILVRDAYLDREGSLRASIGGVIDVANQSGTPQMASGELLRYLSEAVWYPTALLPCAGVRWSPIDDWSATATLGDGPTTVSIDAHFASSGEISSITAMRPREVRGSFVTTPWVAHLSGYSLRGGMQVPGGGDVEWTLPTGTLPYWRGRIVDIHYDLAS
jgi:hypothetical protein